MGTFKIKTLEISYLTATEKKKIVAFLESGLNRAKVNTSIYEIASKDKDVWGIRDITNDNRIHYVIVVSEGVEVMSKDDKANFERKILARREATMTAQIENLGFIQDSLTEKEALAKFAKLAIERLENDPDELWSKVYANGIEHFKSYLQ